MKEYNEALNELKTIHNQMAKSSIYKGYRSFYVALGGIIGLIAVFIQPCFVKKIESRVFVYYWLIIAAINLVLCLLMICYQYFFIESAFQQKITKRVVIQFLPMLIAGALVTLPLHLNNSFISYLPGIWAVIFALGVFNVRPYLPDITSLVGIYFFIAAAGLFYLAYFQSTLLLPVFGLSFSIGLFIGSLVLYFSVGSKKDG